MKPQAKWFLSPNSHHVGNLYEFSMDMGLRFHPMTYWNEVGGCWELHKFPTHLFSTGFGADHGIKFETLEYRFVRTGLILAFSFCVMLVYRSYQSRTPLAFIILSFIIVQLRLVFVPMSGSQYSQ